MIKKLTYGEMEQKVKDLEKEALGRKRVEAEAREWKNRAEEALRVLKESEERYRNLVDLSPDPIAISQDGRLKMASASLIELLGCTQEDLESGSDVIFDFMNEQDNQLIRKMYKDCMGGKEVPNRLIIDIVKKGDTVIPCEASFSVIQFNGRPANLAIVRDVSERKQAEEALKKARDELEKRVKERTIELSEINEALKREIEERKAVEEALRESEKRYRLLAENVSDVIWTYDKDMNLSYISPSIIRLRGYSVDEAMNQTWEQILTPDSLEVAWSTYLKGIEAEKEKDQDVRNNSYVVELEMTCKDGSTVWTEVNAALLRDSDGQAKGIIGISRDISERKAAEKSLIESEERYKSIFKNVAVSIMLLDAEGQMIDVNPYHITHIGKGKITKEDLLTKNFFTHPTVVSAGMSEVFKKVLEGELINIAEYYYPTTTGGTPGYFNARAVPLFAEGEVTGAVIMFEDITNSKRSEELIRNLSHQLIKSQENERQMISRELHDHVAQDISAAKIASEMLLNYKSFSPRVRKKISEISHSLRTTLNALRDLSYDLRPPGLDTPGLTETIFRYCEDFSKKTGINVDFKTAGIDTLKLDYDTKINMYRLVQEALNNIRKHADAGDVNIRFISSFPDIILRIEDNGKGFDVDKRLAAASEEKRMGIQSMEERVALLQGQMSIESVPGKGTKIFVKVPYKESSFATKKKPIGFGKS